MFHQVTFQRLSLNHFIKGGFIALGLNFHTYFLVQVGLVAFDTSQGLNKAFTVDHTQHIIC
jgi:hypothetical protein